MEFYEEPNVDFKLEVVVIPVSDVDRAKTFYGGLGEGFRMPAIAGRASGHGAGVRKPPKHEPAGLRRWSMGISRFAWLW